MQYAGIICPHVSAVCDKQKPKRKGRSKITETETEHQPSSSQLPVRCSRTLMENNTNNRRETTQPRFTLKKPLFLFERL
jgi:hypothetical protein